MSTNKHTPGPWGFIYEHKRFTIDAPSLPVGQRDVAMTFGGTDQNEADARLIAAAPELLECLQYLIQGKPGEAQFDRFYDERVKAARAAIAKATGKDTK
jgi:hypothetical protein